MQVDPKNLIKKHIVWLLIGYLFCIYQYFIENFLIFFFEYDKIKIEEKQKSEFFETKIV